MPASNNPQEEARLLEAFLQRLRHDSEAEPPDGLDPELAEFARRVMLTQRPRRLDRAARGRIWTQALANAQTLHDTDNQEKKTMLMTPTHASGLFGRLPRTLPLTLAASLLALLGLVGMLALFSFQPNDGGIFSAAMQSSAQATPTAAPSLPPAPSGCPVLRGWTPYTVQAGDTLFSILQEAGLHPDDEQDLKDGNCLADPVTLEAGQTLFVPSLTGLECPQPPGEWLAYSVQPQDDLLSIARHFGLPPSETDRWLEANCMPEAAPIFAGQTLYMPLDVLPTPISESNPAQMQATATPIPYDPGRPTAVFGSMSPISGVVAVGAALGSNPGTAVLEVNFELYNGHDAYLVTLDNGQIIIVDRFSGQVIGREAAFARVERNITPAVDFNRAIELATLASSQREYVDVALDVEAGRLVYIVSFFNGTIVTLDAESGEVLFTRQDQLGGIAQPNNFPSQPGNIPPATATLVTGQGAPGVFTLERAIGAVMGLYPGSQIVEAQTLDEDGQTIFRLTLDNGRTVTYTEAGEILSITAAE